MKFGPGTDTNMYAALHGSWNRQPPSVSAPQLANLQTDLIRPLGIQGCLHPWLILGKRRMVANWRYARHQDHLERTSGEQERG
jgi:hypothetical protein